MRRFDNTDAFLFASIGAVCIGVALQLSFGLDVRVMIGLLCVALMALMLNQFDQRWLMVSLICAALSIGLFRATLATQQQQSHTIRTAAGTIDITGTVIADPDVRANGTRVTIELAATSSTSWQGVVLAVITPQSEIRYGDVVEMRGVIETPEAFLTPTNRVFEYGQYEASHGVDMLLRNATIISRKPGDWSVYSLLFDVRHHFDAALLSALPNPHASLAQGILLGEQKGLPPEVMQRFVTSGVVHIVALSGQNIVIVSEAVMRVFGSLLPRAAAFSMSGIAIVMFVMMVGGGASAVRAASMALIALLARYMRRPVLALRVLMLTVGGMVVWNPLLLIYDPSFQLSVLATFALITVSPWVESLLPAWLGPYPGARSLIGTTIAVEIFTLPALLYISGVLSFVALPVNLLVVPMVPYAMALSFVSGFAALIHPYAALVPGALAHASLEWILKITEMAAAVPGASSIINPFPSWIALFLYVPLMALATWQYGRQDAEQKTRQ